MKVGIAARRVLVRTNHCLSEGSGYMTQNNIVGRGVRGFMAACLVVIPCAAARAQESSSANTSQGPRWEVVHNELGNAHGGIELSQHAVPTATNTGQNEGGAGAGERNCNLMGSYLACDEKRLAAMYPTHAVYVAKVKEVAGKNLKAGYIVKADADSTIAEAEHSSIGTTKPSKR